jgi:hypothetical protein
MKAPSVTFAVSCKELKGEVGGAGSALRQEPAGCGHLRASHTLAQSRRRGARSCRRRPIGHHLDRRRVLPKRTLGLAQT